MNKKKDPVKRPGRIGSSSLGNTAGFGTLLNSRLPDFTGPVPSITLDKVVFNSCKHNLTVFRRKCQYISPKFHDLPKFRANKKLCLGRASHFVLILLRFI
jgi:hypothetical protein